LRPVVDGEEAGERLREVEHRPDLPVYPLWPVLGVDDRQVPLDDREGVAEEREALPPVEPLLLGRKVCGTEEAGTLRDRLAVDRRRRARDAVRDVAQLDLGPVRDERSREGFGEAVEPPAEKGPGLRLLPEELLDSGGEGGGQDASPTAFVRAAISTVRSQSL
jgi:hypothetical protein